MRHLPRLPSNASAALLAMFAIAVVTGCGGGGSASGGSADPVDPNAAEVSPPGDIPDNQTFVRFAPAGTGWSVKVPEGWSRSTQGGATTFTDKLNAIRIESVPATVGPTVAKVRRDELPKLATAVRGFRPRRVSMVTRQAGAAVRIVYLADAPHNAVTGKSGRDAVERYVFHHAGTDAVVTLSGPEGADNVDPWRIVTDSVRWQR